MTGDSLHDADVWMIANDLSLMRRLGKRWQVWDDREGVWRWEDDGRGGYVAETLDRVAHVIDKRGAEHGRTRRADVVCGFVQLSLFDGLSGVQGAVKSEVPEGWPTATLDGSAAEPLAPTPTMRAVPKESPPLEPSCPEAVPSTSNYIDVTRDDVARMFDPPFEEPNAAST